MTGSDLRVGLAADPFDDVSIERNAFGRDASVSLIRITTPADIQRETKDLDALIVATHVLTSEHIQALGPDVRLIVRSGIGLDAIDLAAAAQRGIAVANTPSYATTEVAEHALALILATTRRMDHWIRQQRDDWAWNTAEAPPCLAESTLGVVGLGRIGRTLVDLCRPLFGQIVGYDPAPAGADVHCLGSLEELLSVSDVVSLHLPLSSGTERLINDRTLASAKPGSHLVNVSRGGLIDEDALLRALDDGRLSGAGLDVLANEPPDRTHPLLAHSRVIVTPHVAWLSQSSGFRVRHQVVDTIREHFAGRPLTFGAYVGG